MDGSQAVNEGGSCQSCGEAFHANARFCRNCGAPRPAPSHTSGMAAAAQAQAQSAGNDEAPTEVRSYADHSPQRGPAPPPPGAGAPPPGAWPAPGYTAYPGYTMPSGYAAGTDYPSAPGYPGPPLAPPGYPVQHAPVPSEARQENAGNTGWIVGAIAAAVVAVAGIGVGIYFAASGSSGGQTRLLTTPVVTAASAASSPGSAPSEQPVSSAHHASPSLSSPSSPSSSASAQPASATVRTTIDQAGEQRAVADTIQRHFALISEHKFSAAYALLAPSEQTGESSWVASHKEDGIYSVNVAVNAKLSSAESARATIVKMTTLDGHGCKSWSGSWGLTKIDGQWRISEPDISSTPC